MCTRAAAGFSMMQVFDAALMLILLIAGSVAKNVNRYEANHAGNNVLYPLLS